MLSCINPNNELVPIPSKLNREKFTIGAFDNFNHKDVSSISGVSDSHDSVIVLFQNCKNSEKVVQRYLGERSFQASDRKHIGKLKCQDIIPYVAKNAKKQELPSELITNIPFTYEGGKSEKLIAVHARWLH